jgi:glycosyltransferase involved in cell wall biosynthesis
LAETGQPAWFPLDRRIKVINVPELTSSCLPDGDALGSAIDFPPEKGKRFILLQGYAVFPRVVLNALFRAAVYKIVISRWLYELGLKLGVPPHEMVHIPNGIDHDKYRLLAPIENRKPRVAMLYHPMRIKGAKDGLRALELARKQMPNLEAVFFGITLRPERLPDWIEYQSDPPQEELVRDIYNGSSIYLCPSWTEGWHLPPAEAMACGCAIVSTDIGGVRDYAEHEVTALLSPAKNPTALAANIIQLMKDDELRLRLAKAGHERIQQFTWEHSTNLLEQLIKDRIERTSLQNRTC